jgi:hypothetical protein
MDDLAVAAAALVLCIHDTDILYTFVLHHPNPSLFKIFVWSSRESGTKR